MKKKLLIVEDDRDIIELMSFHISKDSYNIEVAETGRLAYEKILKNKYDLIVLDWMIPEITGLDLVTWMKKGDHIQKETLVLMVTAKSEPADVIMGLDAGADDYMIKPFNFDVLRARIKNLLKRSEFLASLKQDGKSENKIALGSLAINTETHQVFLKDDLLDLTYSEFRLLELLALNQGKVLSRKQLMNFIQGEETVAIGRTIDTHISSLRKKLKNYGDCIQTVRGIGYRISYEGIT